MLANKRILYADIRKKFHKFIKLKFGINFKYVQSAKLPAFRLHSGLKTVTHIIG